MGERPKTKKRKAKRTKSSNVTINEQCLDAHLRVLPPPPCDLPRAKSEEPSLENEIKSAASRVPTLVTHSKTQPDQPSVPTLVTHSKTQPASTKSAMTRSRSKQANTKSAAPRSQNPGTPPTWSQRTGEDLPLNLPRKLIVSVADRGSFKMEVGAELRAKDILKTASTKFSLSKRKKLLSLGPHLFNPEDLVSETLDKHQDSRWTSLRVTDFHDLGPKNLYGGFPCRIPLTEHRGIKVRQLEALTDFIGVYCGGWYETATFRDDYGEVLKCSEVNLYQVNTWVIKPSTVDWGLSGCSYVELAAEGPDDQRPAWFVSHFWGEPVARFTECLRGHIATRGLDPETAFWVCAYANNQHELANDITADPRDTSFFRAMALAQGILLILDSQGTPFTRIWCCYEISVALSAPDKLLLDIGTTSSREGARILTDGLTEAEESMLPLLAGLHRGCREGRFPPNALQAGLRVDIRNAQASVLSDKVHILNAIAGVGASQIEQEPPESHPNFRRVNKSLSAIFILSGWAGAVERGTSQKTMVTIGKMLKKCEDRKAVELSFAGSAHLDDEKLATLAASLPVSLISLRLDLNFTQLKSLEGFGEALADATGCRNLLVLQLRMSGCVNLTCLDSIGRGLAGLQKLNKLELWLSRCKKLQSMQVFADSLGKLHRLNSLTLVMSMCRSLDYGSVTLLRRSINRLLNLRDLWLDFSDCAGVPKGLRRLFKSRVQLNMSCFLESFRRLCGLRPGAEKGGQVWLDDILDYVESDTRSMPGTPIEPALRERDMIHADSFSRPHADHTSTTTSEAFFPCSVPSCANRTNDTCGYCELHRRQRHMHRAWGVFHTIAFRLAVACSALSMGFVETKSWIWVTVMYWISVPIVVEHEVLEPKNSTIGVIAVLESILAIIVLTIIFRYTASLMEGVRLMPMRYARVAELLAHGALNSLHKENACVADVGAKMGVRANMDRLGPAPTTRDGAHVYLAPPTSDQQVSTAYKIAIKFEESFKQKVVSRLYAAASKHASKNRPTTMSAGLISLGRHWEERHFGDAMRLPSVYRVHVFCEDFTSVCAVWSALQRKEDSGRIQILCVENGFRDRSQLFGYRCLIGTVKYHEMIASVCIHLTKLVEMKDHSGAAFDVGRAMEALGRPFFWATEMPEPEVKGVHIPKRARAVLCIFRIMALVGVCCAIAIYSVVRWRMAIPYMVMAVVFMWDLYTRSWCDWISVHMSYSGIFYHSFLGFDGTFHVHKVLIIQTWLLVMDAGVMLPYAFERKFEVGGGKLSMREVVLAVLFIGALILTLYSWRRPPGHLNRCRVLTALTALHVVLWDFFMIFALTFGDIRSTFNTLHKSHDSIALIAFAHTMTVSRAVEEAINLKKVESEVDVPDFSKKWVLRGIASALYGTILTFVILACGNVWHTWESAQEIFGVPESSRWRYMFRE